jgi:hypothetical protein
MVQMDHGSRRDHTVGVEPALTDLRNSRKTHKSVLARLHPSPWRSVPDSAVHFGIIRRSAFSGIPGVPGD